MVQKFEICTDKERVGVQAEPISRRHRDDQLLVDYISVHVVILSSQKNIRQYTLCVLKFETVLHTA